MTTMMAAMEEEAATAAIEVAAEVSEETVVHVVDVAAAVEVASAVTVMTMMVRRAPVQRTSDFLTTSLKTTDTGH